MSNSGGIDTHEVLAAAGTKWNFLPFKPGLVGGHCIGVDPYYPPALVAKKKYLELVGGFTPEMPRYQDWDLALKLARITNLKYIKEPMLLSYVTEGSITQNKKAHGKALEILYKQHADAISGDRRLKAAWLHRLGDARMIDGDRSGVGLLFEAFKLKPDSLRYSVKFIFSLFGSSGVYFAVTGLFRK